LCRDNNLTVRVFDMTEAGNIQRALDGEALGSLVTN
jgi:uridylate kinase